MTERRTYWNEDTQSWEDGSGRGGTPTVTPPPPPGTDLSPPRPPTRRAYALRPPAAGSSTSARPGGTGRRVLWAVIAAAAAVAVATVLVLLRPSGGETSGGAASPADPSASGTGSPAAPGPSAPPADPLPDGYRLVDEEEGFSTAVPEGWDRAPAEEPTEIFEIDYDAPDGARFLRVFEVPESTPERSFEEARRGEGFEELAAPEPFEEAHASGHRMEYRVRVSRETIWYVVDIRFQAADGNLYGVAAYGADNDDLTDERTVAEAALRHWETTG
ncbi:hypothetical protein AB0L74_25050 [Streptomyces sp. NPDC052020]|uniref:hypothetical protein n=1 Tax=Streptomyces sp. NPDC052020 TaxID=3155677 RepID=UPI0034322E6E